MHNHEHEHFHEKDGHTHDNLHKTPDEAAAFLKYTLKHNAHHREELLSLAHSLRHMWLDGEAEEIAACAKELETIDKRLEAVLENLK
ncbi:MAG: hypothetical protein ACOX7I_00510 [Oscillospiraceae bacterium]|jgi:hypothetical protein